MCTASFYITMGSEEDKHVDRMLLFLWETLPFDIWYKHTTFAMTASCEQYIHFTEEIPRQRTARLIVNPHTPPLVLPTSSEI